MRTATALSLLLLLPPCLALPLGGCRGLVRESFRPPKVRLVDVEPGGDVRQALRGGNLRLVAVLQVANPNPYDLSLSRIVYSGHIASIRVAEGEHPRESVLPARGETLVRAPLEVNPSAFRNALFRILAKRSVDYELNGSLGVRAPVLGVVQVPFSVGGSLDAADLLRAAGIAPE